MRSSAVVAIETEEYAERRERLGVLEQQAIDVGPVLALGVGITVLAGLTFLPALLSTLGQVTLPTGQVIDDIDYNTGSARCDLG